MSVAVGDQVAGMPKAFWLALGVNMIWINASEIFRYFVFVMPMMRAELSMVPDIAPMNFSVFLLWGVWDTILVFATTFYCWLVLEKFGVSIGMVVFAGLSVWGTVFVILWLGLWNMNLAPYNIVVIALPLALIEMIVAAFVVRYYVARM